MSLQRWSVGYTGGAYGGWAWLVLDQGVLSLQPVKTGGYGLVGPPPMPDKSEFPLVHIGETIDVFHAHWRLPGMNGSVLVHASKRTYLANMSWHTVDQEIAPALQATGLFVKVHDTRGSIGQELAASRFFPGLLHHQQDQDGREGS